MELEEITPFHVHSEGNQLAPEEVQAKKHGKTVLLLSPEELTSGDRKKIRKFHKEQNKANKAAKAAEERLLHPEKRLSEQALLAELKADKRVTLSKHQSANGKKGKEQAGDAASSSAAAFANSSSFFSFLQKETETAIHGKKRKEQDSLDSLASKKKQRGDGASSLSVNFKL